MNNDEQVIVYSNATPHGRASRKELQKQYLFNEDNNLHTLNITLLVKHFGHPKELAFMKATCEYQEYLGHAVCHDVKMMLHHKYYHKLFPSN